MPAPLVRRVFCFPAPSAIAIAEGARHIGQVLTFLPAGSRIPGLLLKGTADGSLPQSLLLHGPAGVGKQRLALHLAQAMLCEPSAADVARPCMACRHCRFVSALTHPDLNWVFPRPRPDADASLDEVRRDLAEAIADRVKAQLLYAPPPSAESIFVSTIRMLVQQASMTPALARRKVFIVGDVERMTAQEGVEVAANAFLKLLEEPPANTWIILTSSAPGALLPTVRSRVVAVRVPPRSETDMRVLLSDPDFARKLDEIGVPPSLEERLRIAQGAPGRLLAATESATTGERARRFIDAAIKGDRERLAKLALGVGSAGARGTFSDTLDSLTLELHAEAERAVADGNEHRALAAARAVVAVEEAKQMASGNVNPQLITASLLKTLSRSFA